MWISLFGKLFLDKTPARSRSRLKTLLYRVSAYTFIHMYLRTHQLYFRNDHLHFRSWMYVRQTYIRKSVTVLSTIWFTKGEAYTVFFNFCLNNFFISGISFSIVSPLSTSVEQTTLKTWRPSFAPTRQQPSQKNIATIWFFLIYEIK